MIGAAILEEIVRENPSVFDGAQLSYERLELTPDGNMPEFAVVVFTNSASQQQNGDFHNFIEFWVGVSETVEDAKLKTDRVINTIMVAIRDWLDDDTFMMDRLILTEQESGETFRDVRLFPSSTKARMGDLTNGGITKSVIGEVFYK